MNRKILGASAEVKACEYLQKQGLELVEKNFQCRLGELDLIMREQKSLVFVEVRSRRHSFFIRPEETIDFYKQKKILRTAEYFLRQRFGNRPPMCRFDVVAITANKIDWIMNAFQA